MLRMNSTRLPLSRLVSITLTILIFGALSTVLLSTTACTCLTCGDDDDGPAAGKKQPWPDTIATFRQRIIGLHATNDELYAFTANEFFRYSRDLTLVEARPLVAQYANLGQPAVNNLVYARVTRDLGSGEELLQISLAQNAAATELVAIDSLTPQPLQVIYDGETVGAFNRLGTIYLQPVLRRDTRRVALLRFEIKTNVTFTRITEFRYTGMIDLPAVRDIERVVSSVNYLDGAFFVATKFGAYRVSDAGVVEILTETNAEIRDIFRYDGDFYASQSSAGPMLKSIDGRTWNSSGIATNLRLVSVFGDSAIVSHELEGWTWQLSKKITDQSKPLRLNENFSTSNNSIYFGLVRFGQRYYMSVDNRIFAGDRLDIAE